MRSKNVFMFALLVIIAIVTIVYAAFSTTLTINGTTSQSGTFGVTMTGCTTSVVATGISGATAPSATCTPSGTATGTTGTCSGTFRQPGDSIKCSYTVKNTGNLKAKAGTGPTCTVSGGMATTATSSAATPLYYTTSWTKTALAAGDSAANDFTITITFSASVTTQPTTTTGTVSCTLGYTQDI